MNEHKINQTKDQLKMVDDELKHLTNLFLKLKKNLRQQRTEKERKNEILADIVILYFILSLTKYTRFYSQNHSTICFSSFQKQKIGKVKAEIDFMKGEKCFELKGEKEKRITELSSGLENKRKALDSVLRDVNLCNVSVILIL